MSLTTSTQNQLKLPPLPKLEPCVAPAWARGGHLQTLIGHFLPSPILKEQGERVELDVVGGDRVVAHFIAGASQTVVYLFHGLGGFSHSSYMQRTALLARARGHSVFMFNHRGCGDGSGLAREPYHSGRAEDLSALIAHGRRLFPRHKHLAIGFSLSANALLLLSARQRGDVLPDAAIAVNAPINLGRCAVLLKQGFNRIYDIDFMRQMRGALKVRAHLDKSVADLRVPLLMTLTDFDDLYTAPFGGFKSREDYYETCSAARYFKDIAIPTVALMANDDPFVAAADYQLAAQAARGLSVSDAAKPSVPLPSKLLHIHIENEGGHMGYLCAKPTPLGTRRWLDYALASYMDALTL
jgi:predicted alpha/beta-fold hydrolase